MSPTDNIAQELPPPADRVEAAPGHDTLVAFRNAFKLGGSLLFTWAVAFAIRILLPRHLGPAAFGHMNFADAFTVTAFVLTGFGLDTYIRKEVPIRPHVASEILAGALLTRLAAGTVVLAIAVLAMVALGRPPVVVQLVALFGLGQTALTVGALLAAVLHARGAVDGLSLVNGASKVLWGVGILIGITVHQPLVGVGLSYFVSEAAKTAALFVLARMHANVRFRLDRAATRAAIRLSLPYFANAVAFTAYGRIDVTVLSFIISDERELGWYGAASNLAGLCLLVTPLIGWVLMPLFARARARDPQELHRILCRTMEIVISLAIAMALVVALGADVWVHVIFGSAFAPAAAPLRCLAPMFVLTYVAIVSATCLNVLDRGWLVTAVSASGLVLNPILNVVFVRMARSHLSFPGAPGIGSAVAMLTSEALVVVAMTAALGPVAFDRRSVSVLGRTLLAAAGAIVVDRLAAPLGAARLVPDFLAYAALLLLLRAVRVAEVRQLLRDLAGGPRLSPAA